MPLSEQLLITGMLLMAVGVACVVLSSAAGHFIRAPQQVVPAIPQVQPIQNLVAASESSVSYPVPHEVPLREAPGFSVLVFGILLLVVTGVLGYRWETRRQLQRRPA